MRFSELANHELCRDHVVKLGDTSRDSTDEHHRLCDSDLAALHFDDVAKEYGANLRVSVPSSADAFVCADEDEGWLVEFKNGYVDKATAFEIMKKVYDSLIMVLSLTDKTLDDCRKSLTFVLVANEKKNEEELKKVPAPSGSKALKGMADSMMKKGNDRFVPYGLGIFKRHCLKDVMVVGENDFRTKLLPMISSPWA